MALITPVSSVNRRITIYGCTLAQNYRLSAASRDLSPLSIARLSEEEARKQFRAILFAATDGRPVCPRCQCDAAHEYKVRAEFKCKRCARRFSLTTGTPFHRRKLSFNKILCGIAIFSQSPAGTSAVHLSHVLQVNYRTAWRMAHMLREFIATRDIPKLSGSVEIDGAEFGGHIRPRNIRADAKDHRKYPYRSPKRKKVLVVAAERGGRVRTTVVKRESDAKPFILEHVDRSATVYTDSMPGWNDLHAFFDVKTVNHSKEYVSQEANTNQAESFFSEMRRSQIGVYHKVAGPYFSRYGDELAWRHNHRLCSDKARWESMCRAVIRRAPSEWVGYSWRKRRRATGAAIASASRPQRG
ncbi:IS1595 family transposase [Phenylobacterium soli]|uniref:IS1595 family transposase n=1 Tax=Phenylobacterium soli TaxID=2170551 RepID=A0A328AG13_9CAUL|nr:IS1595 family transposase [Phenylobacterium soli]RAK53541.1 IS1595 family transposase [Phenylobacterium soli]